MQKLAVTYPTLSARARDNIQRYEWAEFFDRVMLDELGYFQAYEQVEMEFTP